MLSRPMTSGFARRHRQSLFGALDVDADSVRCVGGQCLRPRKEEWHSVDFGRVFLLEWLGVSEWVWE